jgi:cytochrome c oxidase assembly protein subunit 15
LVSVHLLLGRDLLIYTPPVRVINAIVVVLAAAVVGIATWLAVRGGDGESPNPEYVGGD